MVEQRPVGRVAVAPLERDVLVGDAQALTGGSEAEPGELVVGAPRLGYAQRNVVDVVLDAWSGRFDQPEPEALGRVKAHDAVRAALDGEPVRETVHRAV